MTDEFDQYRAYYFGNWYLRSIQQGIQAGHVTSTMSLALHRETFGEHTPDVADIYFDWASSPTKILLNGFGSTLMDKYKQIVHALGEALHLPYAWFREPELENCMTSIGIVVPASIFEMYESPADAKLRAFDRINDVSLDNIITRIQTRGPDEEEWLFPTLLYITLKNAPLAT